MTTIRAAVSERPGDQFVLATPTIGGPRAGEVLVEIEAAGVCHTDLSMASGAIPSPYPVVLGHEGAGTVAAVGAGVENLQPGTRVVLTFDYCGTCENCSAGQPSLCFTFMERNFRCERSDGTTSLSIDSKKIHSHFLGQSAFATYAVVPVHCAIPIDSFIPSTTLASFGCGIQTGAGAVLNALKPQPTDSVAVFGLGAVGIAAVMGAKIAGCQTIIAIDPVQSRTELARELGATHAIDPIREDVLREIHRITASGVSYSVEASGAEGMLRTAVDVLRSGGTCALLGAPPATAEASINVFEFLSAGKSIRSVLLGSGRPEKFIPELVRHWENGELPVEKLVTTFPIEKINDAIAQGRDGSVVKPILTMSEP